MRWYASVVAMFCLWVVSPAAAQSVHFLHPHPTPPNVSKGMCLIEGPHVHDYAPHKPLLFIKVDNHWVFVGDPVEYEPQGRKYVYYGHHPVFWAGLDHREARVKHFCYISGPHHHYFPPPRAMQFTRKGGAYWWVGPRPSWYRERYKRYKPVDLYYSRLELPRPVVTVEPPSGYVGLVFGPRGRARPFGGVHAHVGLDLIGGIIEMHHTAPYYGVSVGLPRGGVSVGLPGPVKLRGAPFGHRYSRRRRPPYRYRRHRNRRHGRRNRYHYGYDHGYDHDRVYRRRSHRRRRHTHDERRERNKRKRR